MMESYFSRLLKENLYKIVSNNVIFTICLAVYVFLLLFVLCSKAGKKKWKLPPGPTGVPILGYIPFLSQESYKDLDRLKKVYGSVFSLYLGRNYTVILGDYESVKDAFSKSSTLDRPARIFDFLPDEVGLSSKNGEEWVEQRKFCVKSIKNYGLGQNNWESMIQMEVDDFLEVVASYNGQPVNIDKIVTSSVSNNMSAFVFGRRLPSNHPDRIFLDEELDEIMQQFCQSCIIISFPILRDISTALKIGDLAKTHKRMVEFNKFFRKEVERVKQSYKTEGHNFIVDYLTEMDALKGKTGHYFNETNLLGNIQALFLGGSDTTRTSINWLILIMANFPNIQSTVQKEIDSVLGKNEQIHWSDRKKLPYTFATIMEGQRWRTIAPLNTSRIATEDIQIQGYDIPKGTTIIANNWGLHNDPKYWKQPEKFYPERFLTDDGKQIIAKPDSYVPFSYGKRNCPGEVIAMMEILIYFTSLMQKFTVVVPNGNSINLQGKLGLTYQSYPQKLQFIPR